MIDRFFHAASRFAYREFLRQRQDEKRRAAQAYLALQAKRTRDYEKKVLVGR